MPKFPADDDGMDFFSFLNGTLPDMDAYYDTDALLAQIGRLPLRPDTSWLVVPLPLPEELLPPEVQLNLEGAEPPLMVLILTPDSPQPALFEMAEDPEEAELMVLQVLSEGPDGDREGELEPYRPAALRVPDVQWAFRLGNLLRSTGIGVIHETNPEVQAMMQESLAQMQAQAESQRELFVPRPFLAGLDAGIVREYVQAFRRFMQAGAWDILPPDKPLFAEWTDDAGERRSVYATVMGDMGESFGVAFFPDWLTYAEQIENSFNEELMLAATGGMEAVSSGGQEEFAPQDWAYLQELKLVKGRNPRLPALLRMSAQGTLPPRTPVQVVTGVLNVLANRAEKKATKATSLKGEWNGVKVSYPGRPRDELRPEELAGTVTLTMRGGLHLAPGLTFTVSGPSGELVSKMRAQISRQLENNRQYPELWRALPFRIMRPLPQQPAEEGPEEAPFSPFALLGPQGIRVWQHGLGTTPVTLAQLTRRTDLSDGQGLSIDVRFSPEPTQDFHFELTGQDTTKPDGTSPRQPSPKKTSPKSRK